MGVLIDRIVANRKTQSKIQYKTNRYFPSFRKHKVKHVSQWISIICYLLAWTTIVGQYLQWVHFIMKFRWERTMSSTSAPTSLFVLNKWSTETGWGLADQSESQDKSSCVPPLAQFLFRMTATFFLTLPHQVEELPHSHSGWQHCVLNRADISFSHFQIRWHHP